MVHVFWDFLALFSSSSFVWTFSFLHLSCLIPIFTPLWSLNPFLCVFWSSLSVICKTPFIFNLFSKHEYLLAFSKLTFPLGVLLPHGVLKWWLLLVAWVKCSLCFLLACGGGVGGVVYWNSSTTPVVIFGDYSIYTDEPSGVLASWLPLLYCSCPLLQPFTFMAYLVQMFLNPQCICINWGALRNYRDHSQRVWFG